MKVTLIHGSDVEKSRARFSYIIEKAKEKGFEIVNGNEKELGNLTGSSLFSDKVLFVIEKPKSINLKKIPQDYNLLIWTSGNAGAKIINSLPKGINIEKFELPRLIFKFLDSFYPGNAKEAIRLLDEFCKTEPVELAFAMLGTHLRDLVMLPANPPWRYEKLLRVSEKFGIEKIKQIVTELARLDVEVKTSDTSLRMSLDRLILKNLE